MLKGLRFNTFENKDADFRENVLVFVVSKDIIKFYLVLPLTKFCF